MDIKALQLCSRFALQPNLLGYCGRDSAPAKLYECIVNGKCDGVEAELEKFIVLNPYLQTISQITGKDPFSYEVIEAYWLGSDLLKQIKLQHYDLLVSNLAKQGVPDFLISEIKDKRPKEFIPIHLFNILHVGVGKASGSVPFNLDSINNCMVRWGKVRRASSKGNGQEFRNLGIKEFKDSSKQEKEKPFYFKDLHGLQPGNPTGAVTMTSPELLFMEGRQAKHGREILANHQATVSFRSFQQRGIKPSNNLATVQTIKLIQKNGKYELVKSREQVPYLSELVGDLQVGDNIALHWGWVAGKIQNWEIDCLKYWTERLLESI